jgi:hypothetical protein
MSLEIKPMGGLRHDGSGPLDPSTTLVTAIGGMDLDLRAAALPPGGATVTKVSLVGGVSVVVAPGVRVAVSGFTLIGGRDVERDASTPPDAPVVRVRAFGLVGGVKVRVAA